MENSGLDSDMPLDPPKGDSKEAWLPKLLSYVDTDGAKALLLGQNSSAIGHSSVQLDIARDQKLERIERILEEHTKRNTSAELRAQ